MPLSRFVYDLRDSGRDKLPGAVGPTPQRHDGDKRRALERAVHMRKELPGGRLVLQKATQAGRVENENEQVGSVGKEALCGPGDLIALAQGMKPSVSREATR